MSFSFGTPSSAPATGLSTGFSFGANKPATPGFGLTATSQASTGLFGGTPATSAPAFGTSTPSFGAASTPGFGATASPAFGAATPAFGATATPAFGATTTPAFGATTTPAFGATATPAFGATATPAFGATATPAFGANATPAFGATATPAFGATSAPAFGATSAPAFGATATPAFGTTAPSTLGTSGVGTGLNFGTATTSAAAPTTGLSFGGITATTTASTGLGGLGGFGFGTATTTQNPGFGLFGATSTSAAPSNLFGAKLGTLSVAGSLATTTVTPSLGLGGAAPTSGAGANTTATDGKSEPPKQTKLPNEISVLVDSFKEFVKKQKSLSSEVMRVSIKPLHKVCMEAESTLRAATALQASVAGSRACSRRLRAAAASALQHADLAHTPGFQLEGSAPPACVKELISELEQQLITFRRQMDVANKQMQSSPKLLTEQELTLGIRRMYESLVALAGRLQAVHTQVEAQKEQYLNLRKYVLKDPTDVFDNPTKNSNLDQILREAEGSRKRTKSTNISDYNYSSAVLSDPNAALGNIQQLAGPTPFSYFGNALSPFPNTDTSGQQWQPQTSVTTSFNTSGFGSTSLDSTGFNLQKPPGKRGKQ